MIYDDPPAFPSHGTMGEVTQEGMSLRDFFAASALAGLMSVNPLDAVFAARESYKVAGEMMKQREKE